MPTKYMYCVKYNLLATYALGINLLVNEVIRYDVATAVGYLFLQLYLLYWSV